MFWYLLILGGAIWLVIHHLRQSSEAVGKPAKPPGLTEACPACDKPVRTSARRCEWCDLPLASRRAGHLRELRVTADQVYRLVEENLLDPGIADQVVSAVEQRRNQLLGRVPAPGLPPVPAGAIVPAPTTPAKNEVPYLEVVSEPVMQAVEIPLPPEPPPSLPPVTPQPSAAVSLGLPEPHPAPAPAPAPTRRWTDVLTGFMEQRNILWGEIVGGLLIVGCSVALVISLWRTLEEIPYFPFAIFSAVTLALFGAGLYTLHHWKLEATSRGLLVISSLLVPLNLVVLAGLARGRAGGILEIAVSAAALLILAGVAWRAGKEMVGGDGWTVPLAAVLAPAATLLMPWLEGGADSGWVSLLAGWASACFALAVALRLLALPREGTLPRPRVLGLFLFVGIAAFAVCVALVFLTVQASDLMRTVRGQAGPLSLAGVPVLLAGFLLQRRLSGPDEGVLRTAATGVAMTGLLAMLGAVLLAWSMPGLLLGVCLVNGVALVLLAFRLRVPLAHLAGLPCLVLALLTGAHLLTGHLEFAVLPLHVVSQRIFSGESGVILAGIALALAGLAELLARSRVKEHTLPFALAGLLTGMTALVLVSVFGRDHPGRAGLVYVPVGMAVLASNLRWRRRELAALGHVVLLGGTVWTLSWLAPGPTAVWGIVLGLHTVVLAWLAVVDARDREEQSGWWAAVTGMSLELTILAGAATVVLAIASRGFPHPWQNSVTGLLLVVASLLWAWAGQAPVGTGIATVFGWLTTTHFLACVLPDSLVASPPLTGLLLTATFLMATRLWLSRWGEEGDVHRVYSVTCSQATIWFTVMAVLGIHAELLPGLLTPGLHFLWLGGLWLVLAWVGRSPGWLNAAQVVLTAAAGVLGLAWVEVQPWPAGFHDPRTVSVLGLSLALLGLLWTGVRLLLRRSEKAQMLFWQRHLAPDRIVLAILPWIFLLQVVLGSWSGLVREMLNPQFLPVNPHYFGAPTWLFLTGLLALLTASLWDRDRDFAVPGWVVVGLSLPFCVAVGWDAQFASATALRYAMGIALVVLSVPFWWREPLARLTARVGMLGVSRWSLDLARALLLLGGVGVLVLVAFPATLASAGEVPVPLRALLGIALPLGLASLAVFGHAFRERWAFLVLAGGLLVNLGVSLCTWQVCLTQPAELRWVPLAQANLVVLALVGLGWLALQRRLSASWPPRFGELALLTVQISLGSLGALLLLALPLGWMIGTGGVVLPADLAQIGHWGSWLAGLIAFFAAFGFARRWVPACTSLVLGFSGLGLVSLCATLVSHRVGPAQGWLVLLGGVTLLGGASAGLVVLQSRRKFVLPLARYWVEALAGLLILLGVRGCLSAPYLPWTSAGPVLVAGVFLGIVALALRSSLHVSLSGLCVPLAGFLGWLEWGQGTPDELGFLVAGTLAAGSLLWSILSFRGRIATLFPHAAALGSLLLLALIATLDCLLLEPGLSPVAWVALALVAAAFVAGLWDQRAIFTLPGLYVLGLVAVVLLLDVLGASQRALTLGTLALTSHILLSTVACRLVRRLEPRADALSLASWVTHGPVRLWWIAAQCGLASLVVLLSASLSLVAVEQSDRLAGAVSALLLLLTAIYFSSVLSGTRQILARLAALSLAPLVLAEGGFVFLEPLGIGSPLHHLALAFSAVMLCCLIYRELLPRHLSAGWALSSLRAGLVLAFLALPLLAGVMLLEMRTYNLTRQRTPLAVLEVIHVALGLLTLLVLSLREALRPLGQGFSRGRHVLVYAAEIFLVSFFVHLRWNIPLLRQATAVQYWPFAILLLAFGGAALGEAFRRRGLDVLAVPIHRTGLLLPLLPLLGFWLRPTPQLMEFASSIAPGLAVLLSPLQHLPQHHAGMATLWFLTAILLLGVALTRRSFGYSVAAALTANVGLWMLLTHHGLGLFLHPQLWLVPLGLIVLVSEHVNSDRLTREQRLILRYAGLLLLYISSTADLFIHGLGTNVLFPLALAVLAIAGVLAGIVLRIRAFLFMGVLFLLVDVLSMIWHAAVDRAQTWVWYASGIVLGVAILTLFAVFEKRRDDVLGLVEQIRRWD